MAEIPVCALCGEPMPPGEEMFMYHGYSGPCPVRMKSASVLAPSEAEGSGRAPSEGSAGEAELLADGPREAVTRLVVEALAQMHAWLAWECGRSEEEVDEPDADDVTEKIFAALTPTSTAIEPTAPSTLAANSEPERRAEPEYEAVLEMGVNAVLELLRHEMGPQDRATTATVLTRCFDAYRALRSEPRYTRAEALTMAAEMLRHQGTLVDGAVKRGNRTSKVTMVNGDIYRFAARWLDGRATRG